MDTTPNLQLPFILAAQAQKHVTHNEALLVLDHILQLAAEDRDLTAPPSAPAEGQRFIVAAGATGAWSGHADQIAAWQDGAWTFYSPEEGWLCFLRDEDRLFVWTGAAWVDPASWIATLQNLSRLGVGTTADATNPFSAKVNNALWTAKTEAEGGDGDLRYKMNKESAAKTLSLLMQTNFSGRAEIGLTGDDMLHVKVSADGSAWKEAMIVDPATGDVGFGTSTVYARFHVAKALTIGGGFQEVGRIVGDTTGGIAVGDGGALTFYRTPTQVAAKVGYVHGPGGGENYQLVLYTTNAGTAGERVRVDNVGNMLPSIDNGYSLGTSSNRWSTVYAATGTINTSDARDKTVVGDLAFAGRMVDAIDPVLFRYLVGGTEIVMRDTGTIPEENGDAIAEPLVVPRPGVRIHAGFLAQDIKAAMDAHGTEFAAWGLDDKTDPASRQWTRPDELIAVLWAALKQTRAELLSLRDSEAAP